jgi:hypothetical protein
MGEYDLDHHEMMRLVVRAAYHQAHEEPRPADFPNFRQS